MTQEERIAKRMDEARKLLERASNKRDKAIADLTRAALQLKVARQAVVRIDKQRVALKTEMRKAKKRSAGLNDPLNDIHQ